ncbi:PQQ-binding-like beta-propeller repeat protein [Halonotius sp. GCM10025705]|uniref:outer membrane protein assembly factor BamB family protein n=1 Tax=Halonotius sp. GCM10025705 TaxID=3252678 RepID=UPI00360D0E4B
MDDPRGDSSLQTNLSSPIRSHRSIIYTTEKAVVVRGSSDGALIWRKESPQHCNPDTAPTVAENTIVTADKRVAGWDISTGDRKWEVELPGASAAAQIKNSNGSIYVPYAGGLNGGVISITPGEKITTWSVSMDHAVSSGAVDNTGIYIIDDDGLLRHISNGEVIWEIYMSGNSFGSPDIAGYEVQAPILTDNEVVIPGIEIPSEGTRRGAIFRFDQDDGDYLGANRDVPVIQFDGVVYNDTIIVANESGVIASVDYQGYGTDWERSLDQSITTDPIVVDKTVIVGTGDGIIYGFNADDGNTLWDYQVLNERISGVIGGQDSIYTGGFYNSIGGIHDSQTVSARSEFQNSLRQLHTGKTYGIDTAKATAKLSEASESLSNREYEAAIEHAKEAREVIGNGVSIVRETQDTIRSVRQSANTIGNQTSYNTAETLTKINKAETELQNRNVQAANELALEAESEIKNIESEFKNATTEIDNLNQSISEAREKNITVTNATSTLTTARDQLQNGAFNEATRTANNSRVELSMRIEYIERYRNKRQELTESFETASNEAINVTEGEKLYTQASQNFSQQDYENANDKISQAVNVTQNTIENAQIATQLIKKVEGFSPIQPFVQTLAKNMGSQDHLTTAKEAYNNAQYAKAVESAEAARSAQRNARIIVLAGGVSTVSGYGYYRYNDRSS